MKSNGLYVHPVFFSFPPSQCILCEYVIHTLDQMVTKNSTEQEIRQALERLCSYLPSNIHDECVDLVDQYTDQIIQLLANGLTPEEVIMPSQLVLALSLSLSLQ